MIKQLAFVFSLMVLQCVLSLPAAAQSTNPCVATQTWWAANGSAPIGWDFFSSYPGTYAIVIYAMKASCQSAGAPSEAGHCPTCDGRIIPTAGEPISLASGNTYIQETDVNIPGLSGGLRLSRTWSSTWPATQSTYQIGLFGPNWRSTFEERIFLGGDHYIKYARGDGSFWSFGVNGGVWNVSAPANVVATLVQGTTNWTLTFQSGEQRIFSIASGLLTEIIDRNGNTTQLSYDSLNRLVTVTDPASRHLYFSYSGAGYLVSTVTSDFSTSLSYSYDTYGRLSQVTEPDTTTLSFQYDSNSLISAVLDSNSHTLESHTYDSSGRGLTSSRAGGVEAITVAY